MACAGNYWVLTVSSTGFSNFTNVVQLLSSLSGWRYLNYSSTNTGFNGAKTNCRIARSFDILLININCFAFLAMSVQITIKISTVIKLSGY